MYIYIYIPWGNPTAWWQPSEQPHFLVRIVRPLGRSPNITGEPMEKPW